MVAISPNPSTFVFGCKGSKFLLYANNGDKLFSYRAISGAYAAGGIHSETESKSCFIETLFVYLYYHCGIRSVLDGI